MTVKDRQRVPSLSLEPSALLSVRKHFTAAEERVPGETSKQPAARRPDFAFKMAH